MKNPEKKKSFRQTREEFQRRKKLAEKKQKEEERKQKYLERKEAIEQYKAKKNEKYKVLSKKTKKGQPLLAGRIDLLLEKIKATTDSWNKNKVVQKYSIYNLYCTTKTEIVKFGIYWQLRPRLSKNIWLLWVQSKQIKKVENLQKQLRNSPFWTVQA